MSASKGLVLVTGANGYIAARTVEAFLLAGYSVRGTVRATHSAAGVLEALDSYVQDGRFSVVEVPDITAPGAFDAAVQGVDHVAHLAAPVSLDFKEPADLILRTATESVRNILASAARSPTAAGLKSFVFMSSVVAVKGTSVPEGPHTVTSQEWNEDALPLLEQLGEKAPGPLIYAASKVAAEKAFWKFKEDEKPTFAMTAVNPVFVTGPPLVQPTSVGQVGETFMYVYQIASGEDIPEPLAGFSWYVDVRDVGRVVVGAAEKILDGERILVSAHFGPPQAAADVLRDAVPGLNIKKGTPGEGYRAGFKPEGDLEIDGARAVELMGQNYLPYEKTTVDTFKALEKIL